jgi:orotidine-5'-phosphate decarboxylase
LSVSFGGKLETAFSKYGQLCVGVDPHAELLLEWGLQDNVEGLRTFAFKTLEAAVGQVGIIKPQVSFFERFGAKGFQVLEDFSTEASKTDILVIMDAKRGDIGTTMAAYFDAWLGKAAPFTCDALTVSPYLGFDSLKTVMSNALELGKGIFTLAATSNPEGATLQKAMVSNQTIAASIWESLAELNKVNFGGRDRLGSLGAVLGATLNLNSFGLSAVTNGQTEAATPILAPGFGAQGANLSDTKILFGQGSAQVIPTVSRSVLQAGPAGLAKAITSAKNELALALG